MQSQSTSHPPRHKIKQNKTGVLLNYDLRVIKQQPLFCYNCGSRRAVDGYSWWDKWHKICAGVALALTAFCGLGLPLLETVTRLCRVAFGRKKCRKKSRHAGATPKRPAGARLPPECGGSADTF